jgi:hypothetical protein
LGQQFSEETADGRKCLVRKDMEWTSFKDRNQINIYKYKYKVNVEVKQS